MCLTFGDSHNNNLYIILSLFALVFNDYSCNFHIFALLYHSLGKRMGVKRTNRTFRFIQKSQQSDNQFICLIYN